MDAARITEAALETLDERGLDALTMRAVADRLGVRVGGLYYHLPDKSAMLRAMADEICREAMVGIDSGRPAGADWRETASFICHAVRAAVLGHRDGARVLASGPLNGSLEALALMERLITALEGGIDPARTNEAADALMSYIAGFVIQEQAQGAATGFAAPLAELRARFPRVFRGAGMDDDQVFRGAIAAIIDGFESPGGGPRAEACGSGGQARSVNPGAMTMAARVGRLDLAPLISFAIAAVLGFAVPAVAAAAGCPNEAFRLGASAQLPECRAYEMATPIDKAGGGVYTVTPPKLSIAGDAIEFYSTSSFAGSQGAVLSGAYIARRGAAAWATESADAPQENLEAPLVFASPASSPDLSKTIQISRLALAPGATPGGSNLYLRDNLTGERQLIYTSASTAFFTEYTQPDVGPLVIGGSRDWSHIVFRTGFPLTPEAPEGTNLYDYTGGRLQIVNYIPAAGGGEEIAPNASTTTFYPYARAVSTDGSRIVFSVNGSLFMREGDTRTVPISVSHVKGKKGELLGGEDAFVDRTGNIVYFVSFDPLTGSADCGKGSACLYRYDVATGGLENLTPAGGPEGPQVNGIRAVSEDGSTAVFASTEALAEGATKVEAPENNLYEYREGGLRFISRIDGGAPTQWEMSPDGTYFAYETFLPLSPEDQPGPSCVGGIFQRPSEGDCLDVYVYDAEGGSIVCTTCNGLPERGDSSLGGQSERRPNNLDDEYPRAVLDDGTVFVNTPNRLSPRDLNSAMDVYGRRGATVDLLSPGTSESPALFADATPSGSDVFFTTAQQLVGQDVDGGVDLYDARVDGGLAGQYPPTAPGLCEGEDCRIAAPVAPPVLGFGSRAAEAERCPAQAAAAERAIRQAAALRRRAKKLARGRGRRAAARARRLRRQATHQGHHARALRKRADECRGGGR